MTTYPNPYAPAKRIYRSDHSDALCASRLRALLRGASENLLHGTSESDVPQSFLHGTSENRVPQSFLHDTSENGVPRNLLPGTSDSLRTAPVILCIGTDRIIGDCLGPLVGSMLAKAAGERLAVYGTLERTVHALNLAQINDEIKKKHRGQITIAVDASLGSYEHIGSVFVRPGCLKPGAGVRKNLPWVGDIAITGIANSESNSPYLDLQTARLSTISRMAETICGCILETCIGA